MLLATVGEVDDLILRNFKHPECAHQIADPKNSLFGCQPRNVLLRYFAGVSTFDTQCMSLLQATLSMDAKSGTKVGVTCTMGEEGEGEVLLCSLREGGTESQSLDLIFDHYTEFKVQGDASVHLTGYYIPEYEEGRRPAAQSVLYIVILTLLCTELEDC